MNIDKFSDTIVNCRFCFMCRHLSGIGNVTFTEADTPRIRAALLYGVTLHPEQLKNPDFIETMYRSDLSAACTRHCVSHYEETRLVLAARADIVAAKCAPAPVTDLAVELFKSAQWQAKGSGKVVWFEDPVSAVTPSVGQAFAKLAKAAKVEYQTVTGGCIGKALRVLGMVKEAKKVAGEFGKFVNALGADLLVVSSPAAYDALVNDFKEYGVKLNLNVMHTSEFILSRRLKFKKPVADVYYLESDFLRNYNLDYPYPRQLLDALNVKVKPFGTNDEESYSCGEGAAVLHRLYPKLTEKLAKYVEARADNPKEDLIVVASPYTKAELGKHTMLNVKTLEELAAQALTK